MGVCCEGGGNGIPAGCVFGGRLGGYLFPEANVGDRNGEDVVVTRIRADSEYYLLQLIHQMGN